MPDRPWEEMYDDLMTSVDAAESRAVLAEHDRDVWRKIAEQNPAAVARAVAAEAEVARLRDGIKAMFEAYPNWSDELIDTAMAEYLKEVRRVPGGDSELVPTRDRWSCRICGYKQDWAHESDRVEGEQPDA